MHRTGYGDAEDRPDKRMFAPDHFETAWSTLEQKGWLQDPGRQVLAAKEHPTAVERGVPFPLGGCGRPSRAQEG